MLPVIADLMTGFLANSSEIFLNSATSTITASIGQDWRCCRTFQYDQYQGSKQYITWVFVLTVSALITSSVFVETMNTS
jgi:hypothetical protein